ncbi:MAG: hypothetical protein KME33_37780 [Aetokthonos hydrillicola CCALA 1050]|nr:hypothetical protein [Aetokthonos hydrillicola CCALA 1050]
MMNYKKCLGLFGFLPIASLLLYSQSALAETLKTKTFRITITRSCPEGNISCNKVRYYGRNLKTGNSIHLVGKTIHTTCADGVTPCRFLGYEFRNKQYLYRVTQDGKLQIYEGKKLILEEKGKMTS